MLREVFILWLLLVSVPMPGGWRDLIKRALSAIVMRREVFLLLLLAMILMPGAWRGIAMAATSAIAMLREVFLLLIMILISGAWRVFWAEQTHRAPIVTAIAMRQ